MEPQQIDDLQESFFQKLKKVQVPSQFSGHVPTSSWFTIWDD